MNLEKLYEKYNTLTDAKDKISEHIQDYADAMKGTHGDDKEKKLSVQIISKFFKHFPTLQTQALDAVLDLCEDEDSMIRICAIKALPTICKDAQNNLNKIIYILAQLLQLEDHEYNIASNALKMIYKDFSQDVIKALFQYIQNSTDVNAREKCISFILKTLLATPVNCNKGDIEDLVIEESRKLLTYANPEEFVIIMPFLTGSKYGKTVSGASKLLETILEQLDIDQDFDAQEQGNTEKLIVCMNFALPLFSPKCESNKFVMYLCDHVLPQWTCFDNVKNAEMIKLQILRALAEFTLHCGELENPSLHVVHVFSLLKSYMPLPPPPEAEEVATIPELDFSSVECLLFTFHRLARQCPDFLTHDKEVLTEFRSRLLYFSRGLQACMKVLSSTVESTIKIRGEDREKMKMAPALLENIKAIIKDLFYVTPVYRVSVTLSFLNKTLSLTSETTSTTIQTTKTQKRHAPITFDGDSSKKQFRSGRGENVKLYTPPSGKFSSNSNFQSYDRSNRGRGGAFRGFRGRGGMKRNWRN